MFFGKFVGEIETYKSYDGSWGWFRGWVFSFPSFEFASNSVFETSKFASFLYLWIIFCLFLFFLFGIFLNYHPRWWAFRIQQRPLSIRSTFLLAQLVIFVNDASLFDESFPKVVCLFIVSAWNRLRVVRVVPYVKLREKIQIGMIQSGRLHQLGLVVMRLKKWLLLPCRHECFVQWRQKVC